MAEKRDYYEVLGVDKNASADDIKAAYRKAALKWHPDRWVSGTDAEKKNAEDKFKEASEAYSVLSDPNKKANYDRFGFAGVDGQAGPDFSQGFGDLNDILKNIFGEGFGGFSGFGGFGGFGGSSSGSERAGQRVYRGRDIRTSVSLTLEEIANGCDKEVSIERSRPCPECNGVGTKNASDVKTCPTCKGSGRVQHITNTFFGRAVSETTCPQCQGEGKIVNNPCRSCGGTGLIRKRETVRVRIPAGVADGQEIIIRGEGHSAPHNGQNGDLRLVIKEQANSEIIRDGNNLFCTKIISVTDAILGCRITVPGVDGSSNEIKLDPGTQSGTVVKLRGKGLPTPNGGYLSSKGDMYVKILVWIPRKLDRDEKSKIESLQYSSSFRPDPNRDDKAIFEKEKKFF